MTSPKIDVAYVAQLARLKLSDDEKSRFQAQLGQILSHVEQLKKLDVEKIEPTAHAAAKTNVFREDFVLPSIPVKEALANAPRQSNDLFVVPKVVE